MPKILDERFPKILNLDASPRLLKEFEAFFIKNLRFNSNENVPTGTQGSNAGALTPFQSTAQVCLDELLPDTGNNQCIGTYECKKTSELYYFNYNSENNHGIYRIDVDGCTQVYLGSCLNFSNDARYSISDHRVHLAVVSDTDDIINNNIFKKFLIFTDGLNPIRFIDVETSIATDSFNATLYPYWTPLYPFCDPCEYIELATRPPYDCPKVELIDFNEADANLPNNILYETFQFRSRYILTDSRQTAWSPISPLVYVPIANCENGVGSPRCFNININAGSPLVEKIQVAFRTCGTKKGTLQTDIGQDVPSTWMLYDTINKYDDCGDSSPANEFWGRSIILNDYCVPYEEECDYIFNLCDLISEPPYDNVSITIGGTTYNSGAIADFAAFYVWLESLGFIGSIGNCVFSVIFENLFTQKYTGISISVMTFTNIDGTTILESDPPENCVPIPCPCAGNYTETTSTWSFDFSPTIYPISTAQITIDSIVYSITQQIDNITELVEWLNSLNQGEFLISGTDIYIVESGSIVYGDIVTNIDTSPSTENTITPVITTEVISCEGNTFDYVFCHDKQCIAIDEKETDQDYDDVARKAVALTSLNNKIATGNNLKGFNPVPCSEIDKFQMGYTFASADACPVVYHKISGYLVIHNPIVNLNQPIHKAKTTYPDTNLFGGISTDGDLQAGLGSAYGIGYGQKFPDDNKGFIVVANNSIYSRTKQQQYSPSGVLINANAGVLDSDSASARNTIAGQIDLGRYYAQYFEMFVPDGDYVLRVASHDSLETDSDVDKTSTYTYGHLAAAQIYDPKGTYSTTSYSNALRKEIVISVCGADVDVNLTYGTFLLADLTHPGDLTLKTFVLFGYTMDANSVPIELAFLGLSGEAATQVTYYTDHNGFYFVCWDVGAFPANAGVDIYVAYGATAGWIGQTFAITAYPNEADQHDMIIVDDNNPDPLSPFAECGFVLFTGTVLDADSGIGINGVPVIITHSQITYTTNDGYYEIRLHVFSNNGGLGVGDLKRGFNNVSNDSIIISQNGACILQNVDCSPACLYIANLTDFVEADFDCDSSYVYTTQSFVLINVDNNGVKSGTLYKVGWKLHDKNKRHTFIQHQDSYNLQIPFITQYPAFTPPSLWWQLTAMPVIPPEFQDGFISFYITTNPVSFWLQWAVSKVEFLDGKGAVITDTVGNPISIGAVKIKIYVLGLNNYNTQNNFQTNTVFDFEVGDMVKFIDDGSGNTFNASLIDVAITGSGFSNLPLNPPAPDAENNPAEKDNLGTAFIIDFDSRLADIQAGAWFEVYRPAECEGEDAFYETCQTYPIVDGVIQINCVDVVINTHYTINYFDTYIFNRSIPQDDANGNPNIFNAPHPYEHHSPSDFWGSHCASLGRVNVKNPYEKEIWRSNEVAYSNGINYDNGFINGLSTFVTGNSKNFEDQSRGDIIALKAAIDEMIAVCEFSFFVFGIADNIVRVKNDGTLTTAGSDYLGKANQNKAASYGAQYEYTRTILFFNGLVFWIDAKERTPILSDWSNAIPVNTNLMGYFNDKLSYIEKWNRENANQFQVHCGIDRINNNIYVTFVKRESESVFLISRWHINNTTTYSKLKNETLVYDFKSKAWVCSVSFTPECYGHLSELFYSFVNGDSFVHNSKDTTTYNEFYGIQCLRAIGLPFNAYDSVIKVFTSVAVECVNHGWRIDPITTDTKNQLTYIPLEQMEKKEDVFYAVIPMDLNSPFPNGLMALADGDVCRGHYISLVLVGDPAFDAVYAEVFKIFVYSFASNLSVQK